MKRKSIRLFLSAGFIAFMANSEVLTFPYANTKWKIAPFISH